MHNEHMENSSTPLLRRVSPGQTPTLTPNPSRRMMTSTTKDLGNKSNFIIPKPTFGDEDEIQTVTVSDINNTQLNVKSLGSIFSSINKSVSTAMNTIRSLQQPQNGGPPQQNQPSLIKPPLASQPPGMPAVRQSGSMPGGVPPSAQQGRTHTNNVSNVASIPQPHSSSHSGRTSGGPDRTTGADQERDVSDSFRTPKHRYEDGQGPSLQSNYNRPQHLPYPVERPSLHSPTQFRHFPARSRSPSPSHKNIGFAAAVTDLVEQAHSIAERDRYANFRKRNVQQVLKLKMLRI